MTRTIEQVVALAEYIVQASEALFGYVFEVAPGAKTFSRGRPVLGTITDEQLLKSYYKVIGERTLETLGRHTDQAFPLTSPNDANEDDHGWFAALITRSVGASACVAIVYKFYDGPEAVRTLRMLEMIMMADEPNPLPKRTQKKPGQP